VEDDPVLLDTHCHIDQYRDPSSVVESCERQGILTIAVTNLPSHYKIGVQHVAHLHHIKMALGFHPLAVAKQDRELDEFLRLVPGAACVGEIGLDFSRDGLSSKSQQLAAFRAIIKAISGTQKFLSLHSRGAEESVLDILNEFKVELAVFHWYTGSLIALDRAIAGGFYFSINPAMIRSDKGQRIVARIPRSRVLTETDSPYVKMGSRPAEPRDVSVVIQFLAKVWGGSAEDASVQVLDNYRQMVP
jgi:TatD DNase family protein